MLSGRFLTLFAVAILLVAACGEDDIDTSGAEPSPTAEVAPTQPAEQEPDPAATPTDDATDEPPADTGDYVLVDTWGEPAILTSPNDVAFMADGTMIVADAGTRQMLVYDTDGELLDAWSVAPMPHGGTQFPSIPGNIAVDDDGHVYVADGLGGSGIVQYDLAGNVLQVVTDVDDETRNRWMDVSVGPDNRLYAVSGMDRNAGGSNDYAFGIHIFTADGELDEFWEAPEDVIPRIISIAEDGTAFVVHHEMASYSGPPGPDAISMIDAANYAETDWHDTAFRVGDFEDVQGLLADGNQIHLSVVSGRDETNSDQYRFMTVDREGEVVTEWDITDHRRIAPGFAMGMTLGPDEMIYLADGANHRILTIDRSGDIVAEMSDDTTLQTARLGGMAFGPEGNLYVVDSLLMQLLVIDPDGAAVDSIPLPHQLRDVMPNTMNLAIDADGSIFVTNATAFPDRLIKVSQDGDVLASVAPGLLTEPESQARISLGPGAIAVGEDGHVYITNNTRSWVVAFDNDLEEPQGFWTPFNDGIGSGLDILIHKGTILALLGGHYNAEDGAVAALVEIDPASDDVSDPIVQFRLPTQDQPEDGLTVRKFAVDSDGFIYAADPVSQQVVKLDMDGEEITRWEVEFPTGMRPPEMYIAVDDTGRIYVTGSDAREIAVYAPAE